MSLKKDYFSSREKNLSVKDKKIIAEFPNNALIEVTNACNHACVFCYNPRMKRKIKTLDLNLFKNFIENAYRSGLEEIGLYSTGEPFMTRNIDSYVEIAKKAKIKRIYVTTNGALADIEIVKRCIQKGLSSIKFSINSGTRENYKIIHGHDDFLKVKKNVRDIKDYIDQNNLNVQLLSSFVYTNLTKNELETFKKEFPKIFEDIQFIKAHNQSGSLVTENKKITSNIKLKDTKFTYKPCEMLWNRLHLTSEGFLTACCTDYENNLIYQKYDSNQSLVAQFNSSKIANLRKRHLENDLDGLLCKACIYNKEFSHEPLSKTETSYYKENQNKLNHLKNRINKLDPKIDIN
jgi:pyruvate-formate lyase-activating enzyme